MKTHRTWNQNHFIPTISNPKKTLPGYLFTFCLFGVILWISAGCTQQKQTPIVAVPTPDNTPTLTPALLYTPTAIPTPTITPTPEPLSPAEVFARVAPSIAFIETPIRSGSGILLEDGYILTNLHVVWPYREVRVVFADGTENTAVPVLNWDFLADLAVLGPIDTTLPPLSLTDGEQAIIGSDVFLIGYPGETEKLPQPSITRGLISRLREGDQVGITYFQTDATIAGGQSGGALVSDQGQVIGISGLRFSEADFGLIASAVDILPRVQALIAGETLDGLGEQRLPMDPSGSKKNRVVNLQNQWDEATYIINAPVGDEVEITLDGNRSGFVLNDPRGFPLLYKSHTTETTRGTAKIEITGPHFLTVFPTLSYRGTSSLYSNHELDVFEDPDNGEVVKVGETYVGNIDYPGDKDYFLLFLDPGEIVDISVDSLSIDPYLMFTYAEAGDTEVISDDDSGGGVLGYDAELTYAAPDQTRFTGIFYIVVQDSSFSQNVGAYLLTVQKPDELSPTPIAIEPTPTPIASDLGEMTLYENSEIGFSIQYPADWKAEWVADFGFESVCNQALACFAGSPGILVAISSEETALMPNLTQADYEDLSLQILESNPNLTSDVVTSQIVTQQGKTVSVQYFTMLETLHFARLIYLNQDKLGIIVSFVIPDPFYEEFQPTLEYLLTTFQAD